MLHSMRGTGWRHYRGQISADFYKVTEPYLFNGEEGGKEGLDWAHQQRNQIFTFSQFHRVRESMPEKSTLFLLPSFIHSFVAFVPVLHTKIVAQKPSHFNHISKHLRNLKRAKITQRVCVKPR